MPASVQTPLISAPLAFVMESAIFFKSMPEKQDQQQKAHITD
jgi:hypothetical protein